MREMKDSGIEWIGAIPTHWNCAPIDSEFQEVTRKNLFFKERTSLKFTFGNIVEKKDFNENIDDYVEKTIRNYTCVKPGDIVLNGLNLNFDFVTQRVGQVKTNGVITSAYSSFRIKDSSKISSDFATYLFKSYDNCKAFHNMGGGVRKILNFSELKKNYFVFPSITEQNKISDFLDKKCSEIDSLSADIQTQIDTLEEYKKSIITEAVTKGLNPNVEMKDSGIEWIGSIPKHWTVKPIKYMYKIISGGTPNSSHIEYWDGDIPWVTPADFKTNDYFVSNGKRNITAKGYNSCNTTIVPKGSIIFSKRAPIGSVVLAKAPLCTNQGCLSLINRSNVNNKFYYYVISVYTDIFNLFGSGTTFKELSAQVFSNMKLVYPLKKEQDIIVNYLDEKCSEIDNAINKKQQQLETLEGYKKSLIYEYVTGKKEIA